MHKEFTEFHENGNIKRKGILKEGELNFDMYIIKSKSIKPKDCFAHRKVNIFRK